MTFTKRGALAASIAAFALLLTSCSSSGSGEGGTETVRLGVVGESNPYWVDFVDAAAEEGIEVDLVDFQDYNQPNPALSNGDLDLNQFQHVVYLAEYNVANDDDLVPIGSTAIYPLALFSDTYQSVDEIPEGSEIAIPNDVVNRARALLVLQSAGLLELEGGGSIFSTPDEIDPETSKVTIVEVQADLVPNSLADVAGGVVNNEFATKAGLDYADAIAQDDPQDPNALPYVNIFAARAEDQDNETYLKLVEIYQGTQAVQDGVVNDSGGTAVMTSVPVADLLASLERVQDDVRANS
ncbi:MetQ/NlpA family ABC transporter substrate-binding protein [Leucobacter triazinivorans]|uniref:Methionine ABC transporter substrate-binding protein n=1 Tax=Leucobacter triazinivorans TaxID=1784719 RepID=A0A4P6KCB1_9MICO|nr:MetQ/NlpA family ABC transporter substrate-binding protein [Leucobacter triazinivorans]QBE47488.1 methionine ABC transporter substrate-binding protein [Leucobacter triazinivorans]